MGELIAPSVPSYMCSVLISAIPKIFLVLAASAVAAYRTELFFAYELEEMKRVNDQIGDQTDKTSIGVEDTGLPTEVCWYVEDSGDYRGDRFCNNAMGAAVLTVITAVMLMIIDMIVPCLSAGYVRLATLFTILWAVLTAAHWLVTGALLADLYRRYCSNKMNGEECGDEDRRFTVLIVMSFACAGGWGVVVLHSLVRLCCGRRESHNDKTYAT